MVVRVTIFWLALGTFVLVKGLKLPAETGEVEKKPPLETTKTTPVTNTPPTQGDEIIPEDSQPKSRQSIQGQCCKTYTPPMCHFYQDLSTWASQSPGYSSSLGSVQWVTGLSAPILSETNPCHRQGVVKVTPGPQTRRVHVYFSLCNVTGISFNVGDSDTNNGYGGDSGTSAGWCAEIHNVNKRMLVYENVAWKNPGPPVQFNYIPQYFEGIDYTTWHLQLDKCNNLRMETHPLEMRTVFEMRQDHMFKFDPFYVGLNRVVYGPFGRTGTGACDVCIAFETSSCSGWYAGYQYCSC